MSSSRRDMSEPIKPSIMARSAEGATGYAGFTEDAESERARAFIRERVAEMRERQEQQ